MSDSFKYNRDLLRKQKRKYFDKENWLVVRAELLEDHQHVSEGDLKLIRATAIMERNLERKRSMFVLLVSICIGVTLLTKLIKFLN